MNDVLNRIGRSRGDDNMLWLDSVDWVEVGVKERGKSIAQCGIAAMGCRQGEGLDWSVAYFLAAISSDLLREFVLYCRLEELEQLMPKNLVLGV